MEKVIPGLPPITCWLVLLSVMLTVYSSSVPRRKKPGCFDAFIFTIELRIITNILNNDLGIDPNIFRCMLFISLYKYNQIFIETIEPESQQYFYQKDWLSRTLSKIKYEQ